MWSGTIRIRCRHRFTEGDSRTDPSVAAQKSSLDERSVSGKTSGARGGQAGGIGNSYVISSARSAVPSSSCEFSDASSFFT